MTGGQRPPVTAPGTVTGADVENSTGPSTAVVPDVAAPAPTQVTTAGSSLIFNLVWDSSVSSAPSGFMTDVIAAARFLESQLSDAVTINVEVGYNEIGGGPLEPGALGESGTDLTSVSYASLVTALTNTDSTDATDQSVLASLPEASPVSGTYLVTPAQAKALGLAPANGKQTDGEVGFAPASEFTYSLTNTTGTVAAGTYDMFSTVVHELTEVMGRKLLTDSSGGVSPGYSLLNLLHYSAPGMRDFSASTPGYFSVDGGASNLGEFNTVARGDAGDWAASVTENSFDAFDTPGVLHTVTGNDLTELDAIGWNLTGVSSLARVLDWTGASDSDFANALNWNDTTDGLDPAVIAPGTLDLATIANGGSITGSGTAYQLSFSGSNTVVGVLTAIDQLAEGGGSLTVTGTLTVAGANLSGTLSAASGGRATSNGAVYILPGAVIAADSLSSIEIGTAGTAAPGGITVDAAEGGVGGDGTLAASVVNNGTIVAYRGMAGSNVLEITGAVTGSGTLGLESGAVSGTGVITPGAVLQLDSSVASSQIVGFSASVDQSQAPTLRLTDPAAFAGTLGAFDSPGDTLVLVGQTIVAASISGFTLTVTRTMGAPLSFNLGQGEAQTSALRTSGPDITILPARELDWTGAGDTDFANALNWNDTTNELDPALTAPGTLDLASVTNAGSITGSGAAYQLNFSGTNTVLGALTATSVLTENSGSLTVTGTLTAINALNEDSALLTVTGSLTAANVNLNGGTLSAAAGGRATFTGTVYLSPFSSGPMISVDSNSSVEIGTAGTTTPGAITVDAVGGSISGAGTLAASVINNGSIYAQSADGAIGASNTMEITGAVTGTGWLYPESGPDLFPGSTNAGAVLRLDSAVASSQTVAFPAASGSSVAPTLLLADPSAFAGYLSAFDGVGDALVLAGQTVMAATISGSVLTVAVADGAPLTFNLLNTPSSTPLAVSGGEVVVKELPRTLVWAGNPAFGFNSTAFTNSSNWDDVTNGLTPAASAPDAIDMAEFSGGGGAISGTGTVAGLQFGGSAQWLLGTTSTLIAVGTAGVMVGGGGAGVLALTSGATISSLGTTDDVSGSLLRAASVTVDGAGSTWNSGGELMIGGTGLGSLVIQASGTVTAGSAVIANSAAASGSSAGVNGPGSQFIVPGTLDVGAAGSSSLQISNGATMIAGSLDAGNIASAVAQIGLFGAGTELIVANAATVADDGTGVLSVLGGAIFAATNLTIGSQADSSGALVVSGSGSAVQLSGALNIGTATGTGDLTVGPGAAVRASVVNLRGQVVLEGGLLDPAVQLINQSQIAGGFGTIAAGDIVDEGVIQAGDDNASQKLLLVEGNVAGGGTLTVNGTSQGSSTAGVLQINAGGTLELTGAVLNAATTTFLDNLTPADTYTVKNSVVDVAFADAAGVLQLNDIAGFAGTISTVHAGDTFVIAGGTLSGLDVTNGNTLSMSDSGPGAGPEGIDQIIFGSAISAAGFNIVNGDTVQVACFAAGTRIATARGPVAVEALRVGDLAVTTDGYGGIRTGLRSAFVDLPRADDRMTTGDEPREPIVWIGQRAVNCERHLKPELAWPVRVLAGAFGKHIPTCDLYLSPDHAVFVNGVLVPVKLLINGSSITQVRTDRVRYFHVELPRHAVILAEGLPVESYLNTGERANFNQNGAIIRLFPDFAARLAPETALAWETRGTASLVMTGEKLAAARQCIAEPAVA